MRSIIVSVRPEYAEWMANGTKTIEVRKTRPKTEMPFKCYVYCAKSKLALLRDERDTEEPVKRDVWGHAEFHESCGMTVLGGKVIGRFICKKIDWMTHCGTIRNDIRLRIADKERLRYMDIDKAYLDRCCLSFAKIEKYANGGDLYGWHMSDLAIYDKPKSLGDFGLIRPPQSWCYVEEEGDG